MVVAAFAFASARGECTHALPSRTAGDLLGNSFGPFRIGVQSIARAVCRADLQHTHNISLSAESVQDRTGETDQVYTIIRR